MAVIGNFYALYIAGQRVALATSNSTTLSTDMADTTSKDDAGWSSSQPVKNGLTADIEGFYTSAIGNALQFPEDLTNAAWVKTGCTISGTKEIGPTGQVQAQRIIGLSSGDTVRQTIATYGTLAATICYSLWLKGSGNITISIGDDGTDASHLITLSATWTRVFVTHLLSAPLNIFVGLDAGTATQVDVFGQQLEIGTSPGNYIGSAHLVKQLSDAEIAGQVITIRHSTDLTGDFTLSGQAFITNVNFKAKANDVVQFTASLTATGIETVATV